MAKNPFLWWLPEGEAAPKGKAGQDKAAKASGRAAAPATAKAKPVVKAATNKAASTRAGAGKAPQAKPAGKATSAPAAKPAPAGKKSAPAAKPVTAKPEVKPAAKATVAAVEAADLTSSAGHLIRRAQQIAVAIFLDHCGEHGLTPVQYDALRAVAAHPGVDATRIAGMVALDRTTISGVLERLESKGLIARSADETDRRAKLLEVTAHGRKLIRKVEPAVATAQEAILAPLTKQEKAQLIGLLTKLVDLNNDASRAPRKVGDDS